LLANPKAAAAQELGLEFEDDAQVVVHQEPPNSLHIVLPMKPAGITETEEKMRRCQEAGAAAVVMKSWFEEEVCRVAPSPRYHVIRHDMGLEKSFSFFSYEQASEWDLDRYAQEVRGAKAELDIKIIPSINCVTDEG
jgi:dihydroorotate dehydrogenase